MATTIGITPAIGFEKPQVGIILASNTTSFSLEKTDARDHTGRRTGSAIIDDTVEHTMTGELPNDSTAFASVKLGSQITIANTPPALGLGDNSGVHLVTGANTGASRNEFTTFEINVEIMPFSATA